MRLGYLDALPMFVVPRGKYYLTINSMSRRGEPLGFENLSYKKIKKKNSTLINIVIQWLIMIITLAIATYLCVLIFTNDDASRLDKLEKAHMLDDSEDRALENRVQALTAALADQSQAIGQNTAALADQSQAIGQNTQAILGNESQILNQSQALGEQSQAILANSENIDELDVVDESLSYRINALGSRVTTNENSITINQNILDNELEGRILDVVNDNFDFGGGGGIF